MKKKLYVFVWLLGLSSSVSWAQVTDVKSEFKLINDNYASTTKLSMTVIFKVYVGDVTQPTEMQAGFYRLDNGKVNVKYFGVETVLNNRMMVTVDNVAKSVIIDSLVASPIAPRTVSQTFLDSLFLYYKDVRSVMTGTNTKKYEFVYEDSELLKTEVVVNTSTLFITKITNYYRENMEVEPGVFKRVRSEIEFSRINTSPTFTDEFNINRIVTKSGSVYSVKQQYAGYTLINSL